MDDRTVLSSRPDVVEGAVLVWNQFAMRRKLLENMEKAQWSLRYPLWRVMNALWRSSVPLLARRNFGTVEIVRSRVTGIGKPWTWCIALAYCLRPNG